MIRISDTLYSSRLIKIREVMASKKLDAVLVTDMTNVRYLTGFTGSSGFLFITGKERIFTTDFRYKDQSVQEVKGWDIVIEKRDRIGTIKGLAQKNRIKKLGLESSVSYEFYDRLFRTGLNIIAVGRLIEKLRLTKTDEEISSIREAAQRAENAFLEVKPFMKLGVREQSIALRLEERLKANGCRRIPFQIIVASGSNSALPHAQPTEKKLDRGDLVILDWGAEADGYFSDMTRTLLMRGDRNASKKREIYEIVRKANRTAISAVSPGVKTSEVDKAAREVIKRTGYAEFFGHGTGHGIGLEVHEAPRISWTKSERIRENMVFTIEPGIYVPGLGGVRIEDIVVVGNKKAKVLTSLSKELEII